jgi:hypothetical protein
MLPIARLLGSLFLVLGFVLVLYGYFTDGDPMYGKSLGININFYWGLVVCLSGIAFLGASFLAEWL